MIQIPRLPSHSLYPVQALEKLFQSVPPTDSAPCFVYKVQCPQACSMLKDLSSKLSWGFTSSGALESHVYLQINSPYLTHNMLLGSPMPFMLIYQFLPQLVCIHQAFSRLLKIFQNFCGLFILTTAVFYLMMFLKLSATQGWRRCEYSGFPGLLVASVC